MVTALLFYVYVGICITIFAKNSRNPLFVKDVMIRYIIATFLVVLIVYGSASQIYYDPVRLKESHYLNLLPIRIDNSGKTINRFDKNSLMFWVLNILVTSLYLTFPQAIVFASQIHFYKTKWWPFAKIAASVFGYGIPVVTILFVITSVFSPFPSTNTVLMLVAFAILAYLMWVEVKRDIGDYILDRVNIGTALTAKDLLYAVAGLFKKNKPTDKK